MSDTGTGHGFGRALVAVYAVFALAASARSIFQLATKADEAPVAYALSALAGVVYVVATFALLYMNQPLKLDYLWASLCIMGAVYFIFRG